MSHDFDDKERMPERRSRRDPRIRREEPEKELKVLNDGAVHPVKGTVSKTDARTASRAESKTASRTESKTASRTASAGGAAGGRDKRRAGRSAGTAEGSGLTLRQEREIARKKKIRRFIVMAVAECFVLAAIFGYAYVARQLNKMQKPIFVEKDVQNNDLAVETVEKMKGYWTIAVFGVDARDNAIDKYTNADVNIICNINQDTGEIKLASVFRDSYLNISENGSYNKINQAYFVGGPQQAVSALNRNLDLNITDYMTFNWKAVAEGINVLGGVDIELSNAEFYYINSFITETVKATGIGSHQLTHAGMNHLDGVQAVAYGRLRLMDTDYARTERQRKVIAQALDRKSVV